MLHSFTQLLHFRARLEFNRVEALIEVISESGLNARQGCKLITVPRTLAYFSVFINDRAKCLQNRPRCRKLHTSLTLIGQDNLDDLWPVL